MLVLSTKVGPVKDRLATTEDIAILLVEIRAV
jgi:hypothetical protein